MHLSVLRDLTVSQTIHFNILNLWAQLPNVTALKEQVTI